MKRKINIQLFLITILFVGACNNEKKDGKNGTSHIVTDRFDSKLEIYSPISGSKFTCGEVIPVELKSFEELETKTDSIEIYINEELTKTIKTIPYHTSLKTDLYPVGTITLKFVIYQSTKKDYKTVSCTLLSDITPKLLQYKIVKTYPHDEGAYTQGLEYENGFFYEGTGDWGYSSLRKVNANSGEVLKLRRLDDKVFGEGITVFPNRIFQVTYKSQQGYIYDKETFEIIQDFYYNFKEGWGLTNNGEYIIMSDGTSNLYFLDTVHFTEVSRIQVYNNNGPVTSLNELEYIDGKIYANIYGETQIVVINPNNGKIESYLECKDLVPEKLKKDHIKVLNGIAYNPETNNLYLTGKNWPVLYEIKIE
ncbi:MAG: glutaminyl-peptide cyclotransferase [Bacteroidales bacterium]|nr:glutaminyl-peptide cyclotransferase [Bacteroidales bacterium]